METKKKLGTGAIIGIVVLAIISVATAFSEGWMSIAYFSPLSIVELVVYLFMFLSMAYYALFGYKKPHGNFLRVIIAVFSLNCLSIILDEVESAYHYDLPMSTVLIFVAGIGLVAILSAYMCGRLDRLKENVVPIILVTAIMAARSLYYCFTHNIAYGVFEVLWYFSSSVLWLDIVFAYIIRYREHKEAGLADKN